MSLSVIFSERMSKWKPKREVGALKNVLLELGFRSDGGNLQHRILWLLPTNWQLKHESKSYFRNLQRGCTPAKLYLFVLWKIFNSQIREWSQSLQDAIFNSTWPSSSSPYTFSAITSTSLTLFIIFSAADRALYPYTVKRRDILAPTFPTTKKFPEVGEFCIIDSLKINRMSRGGICQCRHCRRQCKISAISVNFSVFTHFLCFFLLKLLK